MTFRVELSAQAENDATEILDWLSTHDAGDTGQRWMERLEDALETLPRFPRRCSLAPESNLFAFEVRQLLYGTKPHVYRILFVIEDETVYVLHLRHGRRQTLSH